MELLLDAESQIETWQEVILVYNAALKQINTKLEILNDEFSTFINIIRSNILNLELRLRRVS